MDFKYTKIDSSMGIKKDIDKSIIPLIELLNKMDIKLKLVAQVYTKTI